MIWTDSYFETFYSDGRTADMTSCVVKIDHLGIRIEYSEGDRLIAYVGEEDGPGHYRLSCPENGGVAEFHRFYESLMLDGWWNQENYYGMWRVTLQEK
ncbi:hypothetical protein [Methylobacterium bullatum]|uniref:hypothetical protein n=1 Tax=Methylobacterium bullatum TaxID=570505 RepID=UPI0017843AEC|nr:hypothetical protein [Methylobacterium bullatum]